MKTFLVTLMLGLSLSMSYAASDKPLASSGVYQLVLRTEDDGQSAVAVLLKAGQQLGLSEDVFSLIQSKVADQQVGLDLASQYAAQEIKKAGGVQAVQEQMNKNPSFYSYLGELARAAYYRAGVIVP